MKRRLVQVGALVTLAALVTGLVLALTQGRQVTHAPPNEPPVEAQLTPREPQFGDTVVATLVAPAGSRLARKVDFDPYTVVSRASSVEGGRATITYHLRCLEQACVPHGRSKVFRFEPAVWPTLRVHSRLTKADSARPVVRVPPPVSAPAHYRVSPTALGVTLLVLAALLAAGGAALLVAVGVRRIAPTQPRVPPLEHVLAELAASCSNGDSGHRRRALDALARELEPLDASLSAESRVLAWGPREPQAAAISDLTDRVKTAVKG
jgi:hypothetical protein